MKNFFLKNDVFRNKNDFLERCFGKILILKTSFNKIQKNEKDNQIVSENIERIFSLMEKETINPLNFLLFKIDPYIEFTNNI